VGSVNQVQRNALVFARLLTFAILRPVPFTNSHPRLSSVAATFALTRDFQLACFTGLD